MVAVMFFGRSNLGAKRWLAVGSAKFQPSEIMKIGLVLGLARFYHAASADDARLSWQLLIPLAMIGFPAVLVAHQPDLGVLRQVDTRAVEEAPPPGVEDELVDLQHEGPGGRAGRARSITDDARRVMRP